MTATDIPTDNKPVFYVDEKGDDFTFYVPRDADDSVVKKLKNPSAKQKKAIFSLAESVVVKNLTLSADDLEPRKKFWSNFKEQTEERHQFLREKIAAHKRFKSDSLDEASQKSILEALADVLNGAVKDQFLSENSWLKKEEELPEAQKAFVDSLPNKLTRTRWRNRLLLEKTFPDLVFNNQPGRGLICRSYIADYLSVTFRKTSKGEGYKASDYKGKPEKRFDNLFSLSEYCDLLYEEIFRNTGSTQHAHGLLVITGATKSAKSQITRGLIHKFLEEKNRKESDRRHHLVTFEDPVERFFTLKSSPKKPLPWMAHTPRKMDYTPRQKHKDASLLADALSDALRQTPALYFVGETRDKNEWKVLLDFAATGHLIVTTAHAGSLTEAMHKIFAAVNVKTPAARNEVASKLLSIIHLKNDDLTYARTRKTNVLFPALWRRTPRGVASLTSDGLASLIPTRPRKTRTKDGKIEMDVPSCLGRKCLFQQTKAKVTEGELDQLFGKGLTDLEKEAHQKASEWDLQGV